MTIAIKKTPETNLKYLVEMDANTTDQPLTEWAHDPDFSAVEGVAQDYWKWDETAGNIQPMSETEQLLVDEYSTKDIVRTAIGEVKVDINDNFPKSTLAGAPLAVHASYKPTLENSATYAIWCGAGDDMTDPVNGNGQGPLLSIETEIGQPTTSVDIEFDPQYGRVFLHEAYIKYQGGGIGDSLTSTINSYATPLQQVAYLDLIVEDNFIKYSPSGPGTGTHGFADPTKIVLVDRAFWSNGHWDYSPETGLVPNMAGTGRFMISDIEQVVHRYVNRVPCYGDCSTYVSLSSDETTELMNGYFARVILNNASNTVWHVSIVMEIYREATYSP